MSIRRPFAFCCGVLLALVALHWSPASAWALIIGGFGNDPIADPGWPGGAVDVANLKSRVGWWEGPPFGGGRYAFLYRGDSAAMNEALARLGKVTGAKPAVVLHDGPEESSWLGNRGEDVKLEDRRDPRVDWTFTVWIPSRWQLLYNTPTSFFSYNDQNFRRPLAVPQIDVYLGGGEVDWTQVEVPDGLTVRDERAEASPVSLADGSVIEGAIYDLASDKPLADAEVKLAVRGPEGTSVLKTIKSDSDGRYRLDKIDAQVAEVWIGANGYASRAMGRVDLRRPKYLKRDARLVLEASVSGRVTDTAGKPVENAQVRAMAMISADGQGYPMPSLPETKTNERGEFALLMPQGFGQLSVYAAGLHHPLSLDVMPLPAENLEIRMTGTGSLRVEVLDAVGKAKPGVNIFLRGWPKSLGRWSSEGLSDEQGMVVFDGVPPGEYALSTQPDDAAEFKVVRLEEHQDLPVKMSAP